jgi:hypothetical protein
MRKRRLLRKLSIVFSPFGRHDFASLGGAETRFAFTGFSELIAAGPCVFEGWLCGEPVSRYSSMSPPEVGTDEGDPSLVL